MTCVIFLIFLYIFYFLTQPVHPGPTFFHGNTSTNTSCESTKAEPRLIGGRLVKEQTSAPYMVAIGNRVQNKSNWFCGGSLISPNFILTAAHCLTSRNAEVVRLGTTSLKDTSEPTKEFQISNYYRHPLYEFPKSYHDIALIELDKRVDFNQSIRPICLPDDDLDAQDDYADENAYVLGWGAEEIAGDGITELKQVKVKVLNNFNCYQLYLNSSIAPKAFPSGIQVDQICAGDPEGGKDACQGDSGGPLVHKDKYGIVRVIGIVSSGSGCGFKEFPGVYVRVSNYLSWIKRYV